MKYREYKTFCEEEFLKDLEMNLRQNFPTEYSALQAVLAGALEKHAPLEQRTKRGNNKQHCNKDLRKAMMTRSTLKKKANKSGKAEDFAKYKKQRNLLKMEYHLTALRYFAISLQNKECQKLCNT